MKFSEKLLKDKRSPSTPCGGDLETWGVERLRIDSIFFSAVLNTLWPVLRCLWTSLSATSRDLNKAHLAMAPLSHRDLQRSTSLLHLLLLDVAWGFCAGCHKAKSFASIHCMGFKIPQSIPSVVRGAAVHLHCR